MLYNFYLLWNHWWSPVHLDKLIRLLIVNREKLKHLVPKHFKASISSPPKFTCTLDERQLLLRYVISNPQEDNGHIDCALLAEHLTLVIFASVRDVSSWSIIGNVQIEQWRTGVAESLGPRLFERALLANSQNFSFPMHSNLSNSAFGRWQCAENSQEILYQATKANFPFYVLNTGFHKSSTSGKCSLSLGSI